MNLPNKANIVHIERFIKIKSKKKNTKTNINTDQYKGLYHKFYEILGQIFGRKQT